MSNARDAQSDTAPMTAIPLMSFGPQGDDRDCEGRRKKRSPVRVLTAKYIPDLQRMEPRNIGVLVWNDGRIESRFLGVNPDATIEPPRFARRCRRAYQDWVASWVFQCDQDELRDRRTGLMIPRTSEDFLRVLRQNSTVRFRLTEHPPVARQVKPVALTAVADELYRKMVQTTHRARSAKELSAKLRQLASDAVAGSRLERTSRFRRPTTNLMGKLFGVYKPVEVDYAYGINKTTTTVFRRVLPGKGNSTNLAVVIFDALRQWDMGRLRYRCCSLYINGAEADEKVQRDMQLLHKISDAVIDVTHPREAHVEIEAAVGLRRSH